MVIKIIAITIFLSKKVTTISDFKKISFSEVTFLEYKILLQTSLAVIPILFCNFAKRNNVI